MNTQNGSNTQTDLNRVLAKITEIAEKSADDDYIYRGEPEHYEKVCSSLYREYPRAEWIPFDIPQAQEDMLEEAKAYVGKTDDIDETDNIAILTQLQHFGGKTNLIDFTEDYLIALFFACDGSHDKEGRVILLKEESADYDTEKPQRIIDRVESQKSVFVKSPTGFVKPDSVVTIPVDLKLPVLNYLRKYHRISIEVIYNDMHGFIRRNAYMEFLRGATYADKAQKAKTRKKKDKHCEKAIRHYTEALKLNPNLWFVYNNRGVAYAKKGEVDAAIKDYNKAIELKPDYANAYKNRSNAYVKKGEVDTAIKDFSKAIEINPDDAEAYNHRGLAYAKKGEIDTAIKDFSKAIEINPDDTEAYNNRGLAYAKKGEVDTAIKDFSKAINLETDCAGTYNNRGLAYADKGDFDTAIKNYNKAINLKPDYAGTYNDRGNAYAKKGDFDTAIKDYNKAINLETDYAEAYNNRGIAYAEKGDFDTAIKNYNKAIEINPELVATHYNRGDVYLEKGDVAAAIEDYTQAIGLNPEYANAYYNRGMIWLCQAEWKKAKVDLMTAKNKGIDIAAAFHSFYESVADFETKYGVQVPKDIAALLSRD